MHINDEQSCCVRVRKWKIILIAFLKKKTVDGAIVIRVET